MKISVDENIPIISIDALRKMGHTVKDIRGTINEGMTDDSIWEMTQNEKYLLITTNKGFAHYRTQ
jgi:predicted nuclease of predicted toxin-antitoxin system